MDTIARFWNGLTDRNKTVIIVAVAVLLLGVLLSAVVGGYNFAGFGDWLTGWRQ